MDKNELRASITAQKKAMKISEITHFSKVITQKFLESDYYKKYDVIYTYVSYNQEVVTDDIMRQAWKDGKKVAVPKVFGDNMAFCYIESFSDLAPGYNGILEPISDRIALDDRACMIMPGLAFDEEYNRIGYGRGYYDKYISENKTSGFEKIGLCFDFQLVEHIECEDHDEKVLAIITPSKVLDSKK